MLRILFIIAGLLLTPLSWSQTEPSTFSILDNRFRVDPTIKQISFMIYRANPSRSVVLVRPDGVKYYAWKHPDNVSWYEEAGMDIISLENPMPGPWQAVGKVTPANNIKLLSHIELHVEKFPQRLYKNERLKFTARLTQEGKPLVMEDFLRRVRLNVTFTPFVADEELLPQDERPTPAVLGEFYDNGEGLDEVAGDGIFTVEIPISVEPGKFRARVTSGNGVFMRAVEESVLVYPTPITATFIQSRKEEKDHRMVVTGERGMVLPGTVAVHIEQDTPEKKQTFITESSVDKENFTTEFDMPNDPTPGKHVWRGVAYATEGAYQRELVIDLPETGFSVMDKIDVEKTTEAFIKAQEEKKRQLELERIKRDQEEARQQGMLFIVIGNLVVILLGLVGWMLWRKLRVGRSSAPEMQLSAPPKS